MWHKKSLYRVFLFLATMLPNIIAATSMLWFEINRPVFIYEYLLVFLLMAFKIHYFFSWALFVFVFLLDVADIFSKIYLFNLPDFLNSLQFFFNYSINVHQMAIFLMVLSSLIGMFFLFRGIKRKIGNDKGCFQLFVFMFAVTFALDSINGSTFIFSFSSNTNFYKGNIAGFPTNKLYNLASSNFFLITDEPILNPLNKESITFKQFVMDTTNNQMVIIVESFGLIDDTIKRKAFQQSISEVFEQKHWETSWGQTPFTGGTTPAELRELLNCVGDYKYFINQKNAQNFSSIFQIKKQQGFHTRAMHSYKREMFSRHIWWKNIGADEVYFREDLQLLYNFKLKLDYSTSFTSLKDEDAFEFIQTKTDKIGKQFSYLLTENGHLPFMSNVEKPIFSHLFDIDKESVLSEEARNQHKRVSNFLVYVAAHLDDKKFQKLLIVGDHMPPFIKNGDRSFYNNNFVPYCIVTK